MDDLSRALNEADLKIQWAKSHVVKLFRELATILDSDPAKVVIEQDIDTGQQRARMLEYTDFPPSLSLIIGDAVHNIRTAFDYIFVGFTGDKKMSMPVSKTRHGIETISDSYRTIKEKWPSLASFTLDTIQPYEGGKFRLWEVSELDRMDKHRLIIPTKGRAHRLGVVLEDEHGHTIAPVWIRSHIPWPFGKEVKIKSQGDSVADVRFGPGTPVEEEPAIAALLDCCELSLAALEEFKRFFRPGA